VNEKTLPSSHVPQHNYVKPTYYIPPSNNAYIYFRWYNLITQRLK